MKIYTYLLKLHPLHICINLKVSAFLLISTYRYTKMTSLFTKQMCGQPIQNIKYSLLFDTMTLSNLYTFTLFMYVYIIVLSLTTVCFIQRRHIFVFIFSSLFLNLSDFQYLFYKNSKSLIYSEPICCCVFSTHSQRQSTVGDQCQCQWRWGAPTIC